MSAPPHPTRNKMLEADPVLSACRGILACRPRKDPARERQGSSRQLWRDESQRQRPGRSAPGEEPQRGKEDLATSRTAYKKSRAPVPRFLEVLFAAKHRETLSPPRFAFEPAGSVHFSPVKKKGEELLGDLLLSEERLQNLVQT